MNELLIPTVSPNKLIPFSDEKNIKQSRIDKSKRPFDTYVEEMYSFAASTLCIAILPHSPTIQIH